ncbi:hypothetical protein RND71_040482 [Anisodus tanguticus]|uniref:Uncharacterized protein n=1 Tax=Anisodus tanguticus TaxID=243964 RepID=A0AAE1QSP9_9SOLA|nr:hypothetical protein RND71_040482 [Anisodus tanguticus]
MKEEIYVERSRGSSKVKITLLDEEDQEEAQIDDNGDINSYDDDEDEDKEPVGLGVLEKPENSWSLLWELFPSKAGGTPLFFVAGVVPGKEIKFVVVAEEHITALRNTRLFIGNQVTKDAAYPRAFLRMHLNLVIVGLFRRCKKSEIV